MTQLDEHQQVAAHMKLYANAEQLARKSEKFLKNGQIGKARAAFLKAQALLDAAQKYERGRERPHHARDE